MLKNKDIESVTFEEALNGYLANFPNEQQFQYKSLFYTPVGEKNHRIIDNMGKYPVGYFTYDALEKKLFNLSIMYGDSIPDIGEKLQALCSKIFIYTLNRKYARNIFSN